MALITEDGSGMATAESYISVATADAEAAKRGSPSSWTGLTTAQKESALRYATEGMDGLFRWEGTVANLDQALGWPRAAAYDEEDRLQDSDIVPARVQVATYELALFAADNPLNTAYDRGGEVSSVKVGSLSESYFDWAAVEPTVPHLQRIIRGLGAYKGSTAGVAIVARA